MGDTQTRSRRRRTTGLLAVLALVGALLIPLAAITATTASAGTSCEEESPACCPDGSWGRFEWGGYAGQNLYWCDAPPDTPPATAEPTPEPTVEPTVAPTAAPKKAAPAAAKPSYTG